VAASTATSAETSNQRVNDLFDDCSDLTDTSESAAILQKERLASATKNKKAAKGRPKSAAVPASPGSVKKHRSGQPLAKDTGDHPAPKRRHSASAESEEPFSMASEESFPAPRAALRNTNRRSKKRRLESPTEVAPMITAFPLNPVIAKGPVMKYGDLLQPSTDSVSDEPAMEVDHLPGARMVMRLQLPTAIYDQEADEMRIENQAFCFPYQAMVWWIDQKHIELGLFVLSRVGRRYRGAPARRRSGRVFAFSRDLYAMNIRSRTASQYCGWWSFGVKARRHLT